MILVKTALLAAVLLGFFGMGCPGASAQEKDISTAKPDTATRQVGGGVIIADKTGVSLGGTLSVNDTSRTVVATAADGLRKTSDGTVSTVSFNGSMAVGQTKEFKGFVPMATGELKVGTGTSHSEDVGIYATQSDRLNVVKLYLDTSQPLNRALATAGVGMEWVNYSGTFDPSKTRTDGTTGPRETRERIYVYGEAGLSQLGDKQHPVAFVRLGRDLALCKQISGSDKNLLCFNTNLGVSIGTEFTTNGLLGVTLNHKIADDTPKGGGKKYLYAGPTYEYTVVNDFLTGEKAFAGKGMLSIGIATH